MLGSFITLNRKLSESFDRVFLPGWYAVDGNSDFGENFLPQFLTPNMRIFDVGSGKRPYLSVRRKTALAAHVTGLDIDASELARAPEGAYDEIIVADVCTYRGTRDADVVLCRTLLEHVQDQRSAFQALTSLLKPGGILVLFVPSKNALFARLNLMLPESWKRSLLFAIYPETNFAQGFPSYYDQCTPGGFLTLAQQNGLALEKARYYFKSYYFTFFLPLHVLWRLWIVLFRNVRGNEAAETFAMALRKPDDLGSQSAM